MNKHLILVTACCRFDRLNALGKSVKDLLISNLDYGYDIHWLISLDKYNGTGDLDSFLSKFDDSGLTSFSTVWSGKPNQKNYGGDMYNEALTNLIYNLKLDYGNDFDPWIYILDDDNLVHPNLLYGIDMFSSTKPEATILWLPFQQSNCHLDRVIRGTAFLCDKFNQWWLNWLDPSATVIRYSKLLSYGLYEPGSDYDVKIGMKYMKDLDDICFYNDVILKDDTISFAYHNGNRSEAEFDIIDDMFTNNQVSDIQLRLGSNTSGKQSWNIPISPELGKLIYELIKLDYKQNGFIK